MATSNMNLDLPVVSSTLGPAWATMVNAALTLVDSHDHSTGKGPRVTTAGININADLTLNSYNATALRSARFTSQGAPIAVTTDLSCLYVSLGNLYYNDSVGNQIRITTGGAVDVSGAGSITGMGATTASVAYSNVSKIFTFLQNTGVPAKINAGTYLLSPDAATTYSISLTADATLAASYTLTLPAALPGAGTKFVTVTSTGALAFAYDLDDSTLEVSANSIRIKDNGVTTTKIAANAVTPAKLSAFNYQVSSSSGSYSNSSGTTQITNFSRTITTNGRPVRILLMPSTGGASVSSLALQGTPTIGAYIRILRGGVVLSRTRLSVTSGSAGTWSLSPDIEFIDLALAAGTYTYTAETELIAGTVYVENYVMVVYEL